MRARSRAPTRFGNLIFVSERMSEKRPESSSRDPDSDCSEGDKSFLPKIVPFSELARCGDELWIEHEGQLYRLRKTRQGKLILTK